MKKDIIEKRRKQILKSLSTKGYDLNEFVTNDSFEKILKSENKTNYLKQRIKDKKSINKTLSNLKAKRDAKKKSFIEDVYAISENISDVNLSKKGKQLIVNQDRFKKILRMNTLSPKQIRNSINAELFNELKGILIGDSSSNGIISGQIDRFISQEQLNKFMSEINETIKYRNDSVEMVFKFFENLTKLMEDVYAENMWDQGHFKHKDRKTDAEFFLEDLLIVLKRGEI